MHLLPLLYCLSFLVFQSVNAVLVNITVDDAGIDPSTGHSFVYSPEGTWNQGNNCSFCSVKPDPTSMFNQTWHDVTYVPIGDTGNPTGSLNISFTFNGSAIYVFCAIQRFTNMTFFIDNKPVNHFSREIETGFGYNVPVFVNENLTPKEHVFTLMNGAVDGLGNESLVLFDYIIYSHEVSPSQPLTSTPSPSTTAASQAKTHNGLKPGAIGGIAAGASVLGLSLLAGILFWWRRRASLDQASTSESTARPFDTSGSATIGGFSTQRYPTDKWRIPIVSSRRDPTTVGPASPSSPSFQPSSFQPSFPPSSVSSPQVETDAGPLPIHPTENTLPPVYSQVFPARHG
ncbi:hypothetical protein M422DRAFT_34518 [Sphaerobolus stellatus SS14]|uniref:Uncharacterized protein n=1 Tax=Sphaerobolus stellatus (strain SS14) TaxID=990650 RepID=A0A0C9VE76_SPHS4|nr:hypothetical protein M422DRAFT_34518 [Sphaerobolus stellatus SS14]